MPFYEYRPKSGQCEICDGCFVDLQKMSDEPHSNCPECHKECERVFSPPIVSVRGDSFKAAEKSEKRVANYERAQSENLKLREESLRRAGMGTQIEGHTHNCALAGCFAGGASNGDVSTSNPTKRIGDFPYLVGAKK